MQEELVVAIWCLPPLHCHECLVDSHLSDAFSSVFRGKFAFQYLQKIYITV